MSSRMKIKIREVIDSFKDKSFTSEEVFKKLKMDKYDKEVDYVYRILGEMIASRELVSARQWLDRRKSIYKRNGKWNQKN